MGRFSAVVNIALLLGGYGFGQGAMFAAQTLLVATGEYRLLALFGTNFLLAVLGTFLVDAGALTTLARQAAASSREAGSRGPLWQAFWDTSVFRMGLAIALTLVAAIYALSPFADGFSRSYMLSAIPAFLVYAGNAAGLLDGLGFSGISGISGALPYAISALVLVFVRHEQLELAGAILGAAYSAGCLLTVAMQWTVLAKFGWQPRLRATSVRGVRSSARQGTAMLGVVLPGQLYSRAQLLLSQAWLGAEATAFFLYAKQVVNAAIQVIGFVQRVEFPTLVSRLSRADGNLFRIILTSHRLMGAAGIMATVAMFAAGRVAAQWPESRFGPVAPLLSAFSPTILAMTALIMIALALAGMDVVEGLARDVIIFNLIGVAASYLFLRGLGVYAFVAGDLLSTLCGVILLVLRLARSQKNAAAMPAQ